MNIFYIIKPPHLRHPSWALRPAICRSVSFFSTIHTDIANPKNKKQFLHSDLVSAFSYSAALLSLRLALSFSISAHVKKVSLRVKDIEVITATAIAKQHDVMARRGRTLRTTLLLLAAAVTIGVASVADAAVIQTVGGSDLPRCVPIDGGVFEGDLLSQPDGCCTSKPTICRRVNLDR